MTCHTCKFACLHLPFFAECNKEIDGKALHDGWWCPEEFTCSYWEQASKADIDMNAMDWSGAPVIDVD